MVGATKNLGKDHYTSETRYAARNYECLGLHQHKVLFHSYVVTRIEMHMKCSGG